VPRSTLSGEARKAGLGVEVHAESEVSSIDKRPKPRVDVQESISNAKVYCEQNLKAFVSLRDYSAGIHDETIIAPRAADFEPPCPVDGG
jgi:hypothetical protein